MANYMVHVALTKEADADGGGYSAVVLNIPGVQSMGDTIKEAIENVKEAVSVVIESYELDGLVVPWVNLQREKQAESTTGRLRAVRVRLDATRACLSESDALARQLFADYLPHRNGQGLDAEVARESASEARAAWLTHQNDLDALEAEYMGLAMELAEEVCRCEEIK